MRITDIIKKLSQPFPSQTFWSKVNDNIKTQETAFSSSSDAPADPVRSGASNGADMNETKETAPLETVPMEGDEKIQQTLEGVIDMPLSDGNPMDSGYAEGESGTKTEEETAYVLYKKFPGRAGGDLMDSDAGFLQMWKAVNEFLLNISENRKADPSAVMSTAETIINSLRKNDDLVKMLFAKKQSDDITSHLIDVSIVAAKMGFALGYSSDKMKELMICALLHDIGMLRVPEEIFLKKEKLKKTELTEIRKHPEYSYEMLKNSGLPPIVSDVAYQEQEREDGSGYPRGLKGESIHEYAKIIGLSDTYTAMLQPRPQRGRKIPFEIIKEIIEQQKGQFPRHLIRILIEEFSVFPAGLYVKLNTGEIARVVRNNRLAPMRPVIEIVRDSHQKQPQEHREYDMMKEHILRIEDTLFEVT